MALSILQGQQGLQQARPLGFDPRPLAGFRGWRVGPTSGLLVAALDHRPCTERMFFTETFGEPGTAGLVVSPPQMATPGRLLEGPALPSLNYWPTGTAAVWSSAELSWGPWLGPQTPALF